MPIYQYFNSGLSDFYYTTNWQGQNNCCGWAYQNKIVGYAYSSQQPGTVPLYEYWNSTLSDHYYTTKWQGNDNGSGWTYNLLTGRRGKMVFGFSGNPLRNASALSTLITVILLAGCSNGTQPDTSFVPWDSSFSISGIRFPNDSIYRKAVYVSNSNWRLKQFLSKCESRDSVKIGFIGGSITAGAITSSPSRRYSTLFCSSIKRSFTNLKQVIEINAGIGATPSRFGCSRIDADLLSENPDLVVIEFSVNDFGVGDSSFLRATMEGLIRQCLAKNDSVPILLLAMSRGDGSNVQQSQFDVGSYCSLPMISYRDAIWPLIESKQASFETFFQDDPHPNDNGHLVCAYLLYSFIKQAVGDPIGPKVAFPAFRYSDLYQNAGLLTQGDTSVSVSPCGWKIVPKVKGRIGLTASESDTGTLVLKTRKQELTLGIHMQTAGNSGIRIIVDDGLLDTILNDQYSFEYTKFLRVFDIRSDAPHTVEIRRTGSSAATLDYILYAGN